MKVGIVGCGKIAERHLTGYKKINNTEVVVSDLVEEKAEEMADEFDIEYVKDLNNLFQSDELDAIDVCVPTTQHYDVIVEALENDKHVFCEKPLTNSLEEAEEIKEKASVSNKVVMSGYLYRFHPAFQKVKEVLEDRIIGNPYYAIFRVGGRGSHRAWKHKKGEGGGAINEMLVHMLNLVIWYFDGIERVENLFTETILGTREIDGEEIEADAEDITLLDLNTNQDVNVFCESDLITPSYMNYVEIHGTNGSIWTSILDYFPTVVYCKEPKSVYNQGNNFFEYSRVDLFEKELKHFLRSIEEGKKPSLNSLEDSIEILKIIEKIRNEN